MIAADLLSTPLLLLGWAFYVLLLLHALCQAPWLELFSDSRKQHLLLASTCTLSLFWLLRHDFASGLSYQLIGMTAVTLLLNWPFALMAGFFVQLGLFCLGRQGILDWGINGLLLVSLPVGIARLCVAAVEYFAPRNLFLYIFFCAFFPAALTVLLILLSGFFLLLVSGQGSLLAQTSELIGYLCLLMFPEAFINGALVSALVVFEPNLLETFNRTRYLAAPEKNNS